MLTQKFKNADKKRFTIAFCITIVEIIDKHCHRHNVPKVLSTFTH